MKQKKKQKKDKKTKRGVRTKITLVPDDEEDVEDEDEGGIFLEKEDLKLIYNALRKYKPSEMEAHLHGVLLEQFEEILVVDYDEEYPSGN